MLPCLTALANLLNDGRHDSELLDQTLQEVYGATRRLCDPGQISPAGCRVAVTASRISDGKVCLLTNYRGIQQLPAKSEDRLVRSQNNTDSPFLWEA